MSVVHYKFKNNLEYKTIKFEGLSISLGDLKTAIRAQNKTKSGEFDLEITNAQSKEVYEDDSTQIPKNASVVIKRTPIGPKGKALTAAERPESPAGDATLKPTEDADQPSLIPLSKLNKVADLASANATEEDKIAAMMNQAGEEWDPALYAKARGRYSTVAPHGPTPAHYLCYRCRKPGHWIQNCPTNGDPNYDQKVRRTTGIPKSFLRQADNANQKGALFNAETGQYAVPIVDHQAYEQAAVRKRPKDASFVSAEPGKLVPKEYICPICKQIMNNAVVVPCCGESFCDECIVSYLLEKDHVCPSCEKDNVSPDSIVVNKLLRQAIIKFKSNNQESCLSATSSPAAYRDDDSAAMSPAPAVSMSTAATTTSEAEKPPTTVTVVSPSSGTSQVKAPSPNPTTATITTTTTTTVPQALPIIAQTTETTPIVPRETLVDPRYPRIAQVEQAVSEAYHHHRHHQPLRMAAPVHRPAYVVASSAIPHPHTIIHPTVPTLGIPAYAPHVAAHPAAYISARTALPFAALPPELGMLTEDEFRRAQTNLLGRRRRKRDGDISSKKHRSRSRRRDRRQSPSSRRSPSENEGSQRERRRSRSVSWTPSGSSSRTNSSWSHSWSRSKSPSRSYSRSKSRTPVNWDRSRSGSPDEKYAKHVRPEENSKKRKKQEKTLTRKKSKTKLPGKDATGKKPVVESAGEGKTPGAKEKTSKKKTKTEVEKGKDSAKPKGTGKETSKGGKRKESAVAMATASKHKGQTLSSGEERVVVKTVKKSAGGSSKSSRASSPVETKSSKSREMSGKARKDVAKKAKEITGKTLVKSSKIKNEKVDEVKKVEKVIEKKVESKKLDKEKVEKKNVDKKNAERKKDATKSVNKSRESKKVENTKTEKTRVKKVAEKSEPETSKDISKQKTNSKHNINMDTEKSVEAKSSKHIKKKKSDAVLLADKREVRLVNEGGNQEGRQKERPVGKHRVEISEHSEREGETKAKKRSDKKKRNKKEELELEVSEERKSSRKRPKEEDSSEVSEKPAKKKRKHKHSVDEEQSKDNKHKKRKKKKKHRKHKHKKKGKHKEKSKKKATSSGDSEEVVGKDGDKGGKMVVEMQQSESSKTEDENSESEQSVGKESGSEVSVDEGGVSEQGSVPGEEEVEDSDEEEEGEEEEEVEQGSDVELSEEEIEEEEGNSEVEKVDEDEMAVEEELDYGEDEEEVESGDEEKILGEDDDVMGDDVDDEVDDVDDNDMAGQDVVGDDAVGGDVANDVTSDDVVHDVISGEVDVDVIGDEIVEGGVLSKVVGDGVDNDDVMDDDVTSGDVGVEIVHDVMGDNLIGEVVVKDDPVCSRETGDERERLRSAARVDEDQHNTPQISHEERVETELKIPETDCTTDPALSSGATERTGEETELPSKTSKTEIKPVEKTEPTAEFVNKKLDSTKDTTESRQEPRTTGEAPPRTGARSNNAVQKQNIGDKDTNRCQNPKQNNGLARTSPLPETVQQSGAVFDRYDSAGGTISSLDSLPEWNDPNYTDFASSPGNSEKRRTSTEIFQALLSHDYDSDL